MMRREPIEWRKDDDLPMVRKGGQKLRRIRYPDRPDVVYTVTQGPIVHSRAYRGQDTFALMHFYGTPGGNKVHQLLILVSRTLELEEGNWNWSGAICIPDTKYSVTGYVVCRIKDRTHAEQFIRGEWWPQ